MNREAVRESGNETPKPLSGFWRARHGVTQIARPRLMPRSQGAGTSPPGAKPEAFSQEGGCPRPAHEGTIKTREQQKTLKRKKTLLGMSRSGSKAIMRWPPPRQHLSSALRACGKC